MSETTQGRTGKWAKRPGGETTRGERESGRNDSGANVKVGETTRIPLWLWRKIKTVATLCVPDVRETFCFIFYADNFTGSKDTEPYKTDVSFLCQYK